MMATFGLYLCVPGDWKTRMLECLWIEASVTDYVIQSITASQRQRRGERFSQMQEMCTPSCMKNVSEKSSWAVWRVFSKLGVGNKMVHMQMCPSVYANHHCELMCMKKKIKIGRACLGCTEERGLLPSLLISLWAHLLINISSEASCCYQRWAPLARPRSRLPRDPCVTAPPLTRK